jgi:ribulose kinase
MGKMFQNDSSLKPLGQLKPNCPGMIIGRSSVFLCRSEIQDGCHHRTIWGKYRNIFFSEAIALIAGFYN